MRIVAGQEPYVFQPEGGTSGPVRGRPRHSDRHPEQPAADAFGRRLTETPGPAPSGSGRSVFEPDPLGGRRGAGDSARPGAPRSHTGPAAPPLADPYAPEGYPQDTYRDGYDQDDHSRQGYPREGYDQDGYDRNGHDQDGYDREGYDREGYDREGYDREGYVRGGSERPDYGPDRYAREGYRSADGYPPDSYTPADYRAPNGYPADPYYEQRVEPRDGSQPDDQWGYERGTSTPYPGGSPTTGDPFGLDRAAAGPRSPLGAPSDYQRSAPHTPAHGRAPREQGDAYGSCPSCNSRHEAGARFCERCGFDLILREHPATSDPTPLRTGWDVVIEAEREYYDCGDDHRVPFPAIYPRRVFPLTGPRMLIGRRSESRGIHPEIDLSGAPEDPGISRAHAMLELMPDGGYTVLDPGSTNGTRINDEPNPIPRNKPVPLRDGDRIYLGAWTRVTIRLSPK